MGEPVRSEAFDVVLERSGLTVTVPPERSIMSAVEEAGVGVVSSCAEGTCGTCETRVLDGLPDHRDSVLSDDEKADEQLHDDLRLEIVRRPAGAGPLTHGLPTAPIQCGLREPGNAEVRHAVGVVVAMDGTSGSGKSSTSRGVAAALGLRYLDTGAMYRAMTWWMLENGVDTEDPAAVAARVDEPVLVSGTDPAHPTITVGGTDVAEAIRSQRVTSAVSAVSAVPEVRARLLVEQRDAIGDGDIVVEGRDIGTTVAPDADVKVYLTADPSARATRRAAEQLGADVAATQQDLIRRDTIDSGRAASPLTMAADARHIDTTPYTLDEVVAQVVALVRETRG